MAIKSTGAGTADGPRRREPEIASRASRRCARLPAVPAGGGPRAERDHGDGPDLRERAPPRLHLSRRHLVSSVGQRSSRRAAPLRARDSDPTTTRGAPLIRHPHESSTWTTYLSDGGRQVPADPVGFRELMAPSRLPAGVGLRPRPGCHRNLMGPNGLWLTDALTQLLPLEPGMRVLDLGCGAAISSIFLARELGVQVWAADLWIEPDAEPPSHRGSRRRRPRVPDRGRSARAPLRARVLRRAREHRLVPLLRHRRALPLLRRAVRAARRRDRHRRARQRGRSRRPSGRARRSLRRSAPTTARSGARRGGRVIGGAPRVSR